MLRKKPLSTFDVSKLAIGTKIGLISSWNVLWGLKAFYAVSPFRGNAGQF